MLLFQTYKTETKEDKNKSFSFDYVKDLSKKEQTTSTKNDKDKKFDQLDKTKNISIKCLDDACDNRAITKDVRDKCVQDVQKQTTIEGVKGVMLDLANRYAAFQSYYKDFIQEMDRLEREQQEKAKSAKPAGGRQQGEQIKQRAEKAEEMQQVSKAEEAGRDEFFAKYDREKEETKTV